MKSFETELYVDGVGSIMLGYPVAKVTLVTAISVSATDSGSDNAQISNQEVVTITIPITSLVQACETVLSMVAKNKQSLLEAQNRASDKFQHLLDRTV